MLHFEITLYYGQRQLNNSYRQNKTKNLLFSLCQKKNSFFQNQHKITGILMSKILFSKELNCLTYHSYRMHVGGY